MLDREPRGALAPVVKAIEALLGEARLVEVAGRGFEPLYWAFRQLQGREAWTADGPMIERWGMALGAGVAERFAFARDVTDDEVADAAACRAEFRTRFLDILGPDGVMILPTMPDIAPLLAQDEADLEPYRNKALNLLCPAGLAGTPQVTMPLATRDGAPFGISLMGPPGSDLSLLSLAARIAEAAAPEPLC